MGANITASESGRSKIFYAIMIAGVVAISLMIIDGRISRNTRQVTQEAADAGALGGVRYLRGVEDKNESDLQTRINGVVEALGIPDTDGKAANEINRNVSAYYTTASGVRIKGCNEVGACGSVPTLAEGVEVEVINDFEPFLPSMLGIEGLAVSAGAIASS